MHMLPHEDEIRSQFPGLKRLSGNQEAIFLDGPAGSQVPQTVANAVSNYMLHTNANGGGFFATSQESDALMDDCQEVAAALFGASDPCEMVFGPNMTSLTNKISRLLKTQWQSGDEIILSSSEHDANYTPWVKAAESRGVEIKTIPLNTEDCTLDQEAYRALLSPKTKLVAVGLASNASGTIHPIRQMADAAHQVGAKFYVDAVHYAPHGLLDVEALGCDFLVASAYKFFGPHVGILWGKREHLEALPSEKLRPCDSSLPWSMMSGTPNLEGIAGTKAAIEYIAGLSQLPETVSLRERIKASFEAIEHYEKNLLNLLLAGIQETRFKVLGITDPNHMHERVPTLSLVHPNHSTETCARYMAEQGIFTWSGNHYAVPFTEAMGIEPEGTLRIGILHYNTEKEIKRLISALKELDAA